MVRDSYFDVLRQIISQAHNLPRSGTADKIAQLAEQALSSGPNGEDTKRLLFFKDCIDGIGRFDFHEDAAGIAANRGREEPTEDDYLDAIRIAIDMTTSEGWPKAEKCECPHKDACEEAGECLKAMNASPSATSGD